MAKNTKTDEDYIITPVARLAFEHLFEKDMREIKGVPVDKYNATLLFPKDADLGPLKEFARRARDAKWPDPDKRPSNLRSPFRDGNTEGRGEDGELWAGFEDMIFIRVSSKFKPGVVDQKVRPILDPEKVYSGCYVRAQVHAYTYSNMGNKGVSFGLDNVQFVKDGEPLDGGGVPPEKAFDAVSGGGADEGEGTLDDEEDPFAM